METQERRPSGWRKLRHLSGDLQGSPPSIFSADGELGALVDQAAALLHPWPEGLDLRQRRPRLRRSSKPAKTAHPPHR